MNAYSCKPSDHPSDVGMHTLMCIAVLTSGICSVDYCTVYDMDMRPSRGNCLVSDSVSSVRAAVLNPQVSIPFLRAQGAQVWGSGHFAISSIDNGLSSNEKGAHHLLGNTFHATQMAAWQRGKTNDASLLEPSIRQALIVPTVLEELHHVSISPGRDKPVFTSPVDEACFSNAEEDNEYARQAKCTELAFFLRRQDPEIKPLWIVFNQSLSSEEREQTAVGYLPIILAPAHQFDTLNTVVKRCMAISSRFGQEHTVITVDQALYYRLMAIKWSLTQYQDKLIPRLGGLHVTMNFLKAIGDHMNGSGLADVWGRWDCLGRAL